MRNGIVSRQALQNNNWSLPIYHLPGSHAQLEFKGVS